MSNQWTQDQINDLLDSSQGIDSLANLKKQSQKQDVVANYGMEKNVSNTRKSEVEKPEEVSYVRKSQAQKSEENQYGQDEFESYDGSQLNFHNSQSKGSQSIYSQDFDESHRSNAGKNTKNNAAKKLSAIEQEAPASGFTKNKTPNLAQQPNRKENRNMNNTGGNFDQKNRGTSASSFNKQKINATVDAQISSTKQQQKNLAFNFVRLQEREKQLLFTRITEENKILKSESASKDRDFKALQTKYHMLLEEKTKSSTTARQKALEQETVNLKHKVQKLQNLIKIKQKNTPSISHFSRTQTKFVPEQFANQREQEMLGIIDKLKSRLLHSEDQLISVQKKMNEGLNFSEELQRKLKRVEQLEHKIDKMTDQAQADRQYIDHLKDSIKELHGKVQDEKKRVMRVEIQSKRNQLASTTNNDLVMELKETKKEKELLEVALREMSSSLMGNVRRNFEKGRKEGNGNAMEDSQQIFKVK